MSTISACMIVKNEEEVLDQTLNKLENIFDEVIIVDTGSTDHTRDIIHEHSRNSPKIIFDYYHWINDFAAARNYAYSGCVTEFVTWWDADDVMTPGLEELIGVIRSGRMPLIDLYNIATVTHRDEITGEVLRAVDNERIIRYSLFDKWKYRLHEKMFHKYVPPEHQMSFTPDTGVTVEVMRPLHNDSHLAKYKLLVEQGHSFCTHDYYWLAVMMHDCINYELKYWFINNLLYGLPVLNEELWYLGMLVQFLNDISKSDLDANEILSLIEGPIINKLTVSEIDLVPPGQLESLMVDYYRKCGNIDMAKYWYSKLP